MGAQFASAVSEKKHRKHTIALIFLSEQEQKYESANLPRCANNKNHKHNVYDDKSVPDVEATTAKKMVGAASQFDQETVWFPGHTCFSQLKCSDREHFFHRDKDDCCKIRRPPMSSARKPASAIEQRGDTRRGDTLGHYTYVMQLPVPKDKRYTEALIYFSQITQAMATKLETEKYRSLRDTEHRTMGALYWHLNDVWVAPSWSSIDFYGNYKLLHYWAKDFMAPITVIALYDSKARTVNVSVPCDKVEVVAEGAEITMSHHMWSALHAKNKTSWPVILKPNGVAFEKAISINDVFVEPYNTKNSFLEFTLQRTPEVISKTYYFPEPFPFITGVGNPDIRVDVSWKFCSANNNINSNSYTLKIIARKPAIFVYIEITHPEVGKYKLSQNGFMQLVPVEKVELNFEAASCIIIKQSDVRVTTVNDFMSSNE